MQLIKVLQNSWWKRNCKQTSWWHQIPFLPALRYYWAVQVHLKNGLGKTCGQVLMKEIPAAPYKAGIMSLPQIAPLGKKNKEKHQVWEQWMWNINSLLFIHARNWSFGILPHREVSVWVWAHHNPLCTPGGETSVYAVWTTKPVENVGFSWQRKQDLTLCWLSFTRSLIFSCWYLWPTLELNAEFEQTMCKEWLSLVCYKGLCISIKFLTSKILGISVLHYEVGITSPLQAAVFWCNPERIQHRDTLL